jgi:hypothetical protein
MNNQYEIQNDHSEYSDYENFDDEQQMQFDELKKCIKNDDVHRLKYLLIEKKYKWYNELIEDAAIAASFNVINYAIYNIERLHLDYHEYCCRGIDNIMYYLAMNRHYDLLKYYFENNILPINIEVILEIDNTKVFKYFFQKYKYQLLLSDFDHLYDYFDYSMSQLLHKFCLKINIIKYIEKYIPLNKFIWDEQIFYDTVTLLLENNKYDNLNYILKQTIIPIELEKHIRLLLNEYIIKNKKKNYYKKFKNVLHIEIEPFWIKYFTINNFFEIPILNSIKKTLMKNINHTYDVSYL